MNAGVEGYVQVFTVAHWAQKSFDVEHRDPLRCVGWTIMNPLNVL